MSQSVLVRDYVGYHHVVNTPRDRGGGETPQSKHMSSWSSQVGWYESYTVPRFSNVALKSQARVPAMFSVVARMTWHC